MRRPSSSDRGNEGFVQWKEPLELDEAISPGDGHASTTRSRKKNQPRRITVPTGGAQASIHGSAMEDSRRGGRASQVVSEAGGGTSSRSGAELQTVDPSPRFVPPRRVHTTRSTVPVLRSSASEKASEHKTSMDTTGVNNIPAPREVLEDHSAPRAVEVEGFSTPPNISPPQGKC